jgi:malate dehydrogenase (oxaloacetate-decarboxylating)
MQGTGAITLAAAISAVRVCGTPLRSQRVVIDGAGTAGIGVADQIRDAMVREGLSKEDAARRFWCLDRHGLLTAGMPGDLARPSGSVRPPGRGEPILKAGR